MTIEIQIRDCKAHPPSQEVERGELVRYRNMLDHPVVVDFFGVPFYDGSGGVTLEAAGHERAAREMRVRDNLEGGKEYPYRLISSCCPESPVSPDVDGPRMKVRA